MSARPGPCGGHQVTGVPTAIANYQSAFPCAAKWARSRSERLLNTWTIAGEPLRTAKMTANRDAFVPRGVLQYAAGSGEV